MSRFLPLLFTCFLAGNATAQTVVTITLDAWHGNASTCSKIPSAEFAARGGCDGVTPFTWTKDYDSFPLNSTPQTVSVPFLDPGDPDWKISKVHAQVFAVPDWSLAPPTGCPVSSSPIANLALSGAINNQVINSLTPFQIAAEPMCASSPDCSGQTGTFVCAFFNEIWIDQVTAGDFPGFIHGGNNVFSFTFQSLSPRSDIPTLSVEKVILTLTYTCAVCLDIDGTWSASAPVDDNKVFVPGTTISGAEIAPAMTGPPLQQQITLHVLTPGVKGGNKKITVTIAPGAVSRYDGVAGNWPAQAASTGYDMDFGAGVLSKQVAVASSGDTAIPLYVYDYAASAVVTITAPTAAGSTVTYTKKIPRDNDGNGIPDVGWNYLGGHAVDNAISTSDLDVAPTASGDPPAGILGDGLTAFEEYRGFVIGGIHVRLDPTYKDLFARLDPGLDGCDTYLQNLPVTIHEVSATEVSGDNPSQINFRSVAWSGSVVSPTASPIPGVTSQRALRVKERLGLGQMFKTDPITGQQIAVTNSTLWGATYYDGDNQVIVQSFDDSHIQDTDKQLHVDVFTEDIRHRAILLATVNTPADPNARICGVVAAPCDNLTLPDTNNNYHALEPGEDGWQTTVMGGDTYGTWLPNVCGGSPTAPVNILGPTTTDNVIRNTVAHEAGHAVHMIHSTDCNNPGLMLKWLYLLDPIAGTVPSNYTDPDVQQLRLHH